MKALANVPPGERAAHIRPFIGKICKVTFRRGTYGKYDSELTGHIVGASYHATNGNSTGDVIVTTPTRGKVWGIAGEQWSAQSIALVHVHDIVPIDE